MREDGHEEKIAKHDQSSSENKTPFIPPTTGTLTSDNQMLTPDECGGTSTSPEKEERKSTGCADQNLFYGQPTSQAIQINLTAQFERDARLRARSLASSGPDDES